MKTPTHLVSWLVAVAALVFTSGCGRDDRSETTATETGAIVLSPDILGFESTSHWRAGVALTRNNAHTQGSFSLGVAAKGYVPITSVALPPPVTVDSTISVDLWLPTTQANPYWYGTLQVFFNSPSANIYNAYVGLVELTGLPTGAFQTLNLKVPAELLARVNQNATDFTVTIALNVPYNATGVYLLDRLTLATAVAACNASNNGASCDDSNPCTSADKCAANACSGTPVEGCTFDATTNTATVSWNKPAILNAYFPNCTNPGNANAFQHAVPFPIPPVVSIKSKAAVTLALKISRAFRPDVTCTYSAATSASAAARPAALSSCTDGSVAGDVIQATAFSLDVVSAPGVPSPGDGVCSHSPVSAQVPIGTDELPILPEPLSAAETTALRTSFSWAATQPVAELDTAGRPLLYYALVYLESTHQRVFLDDLNIHHDFLPMFEGLERWQGMKGMFVHHGDGQGVYTYAVMIGAQFNFLRTAALAGDVVFKAVNLLNVPAAFANADGKTLSYRALANTGFRYRGVDPTVPLAPILCESDIGGALRSVVHAGAETYQGVADAVSGFIGGLVGDVVGTVSARLRFRPFHTDPSFNDLSLVTQASVANNVIISGQPGIRRRRMQRAWGPAPGFPLDNNGATVELRGSSTFLPSYRSGALENDSDASLEFNKGQATAVCLVPKNDAVDVIDFITTIRICDFGIYKVDKSTLIEFEVASDAMNVFTTMSDNALFAKFVLGFAPEQALTLVGYYADLVPAGGSGFTPCFTKNNLGATLMQNVLTLLSTGAAVKQGDLDRAIALQAVGSCVYEVDMIMPSEQGVARSRGITSHEYGHWMMCDLLGDVGINVAYNAAILERLELGPLQPDENLGECNQACGNEAFADFWSAQVVGGTAYFNFLNSVGDDTGWVENQRGSTIYYCPTATTCFDDNVGGPLQGSTQTPFPSDSDENTRRSNMGRVTSIFHDFVDGQGSFGSDSFSNGSFWRRPAMMNGLNQFDYAPQGGGSIGDEFLVMSGPSICQAVLQRRGTSIDQDALLGGLADEGYRQGANWCQLCQLFANHNPEACTQVAGEPTCVADHCATTTLPASCSGLESDAKLYSVCARSASITKWIGAPPDSSEPISCNFVPQTSCPDGQILSLQGTCIVPPCPGGLLLERDGTCQSSCSPQDVDGEMTPTPIGNGRCLIIVS